MKTSNNNYIAFIDVEETSERAINAQADFYASLSNFQATLINHAPTLKNNGKVYFFSDCAYVQSSDKHCLMKFLQKVRGDLFLQRYYLKGAISKGELSPRSMIPNDKKDFVFGHSFGQDVVKVYGLQSKFRGIGIKIDESCKKDLGNYLVNSCHLPASNSRKADSYYDIRLTKDDVQDDEGIKQLLKHFIISSARVRTLGRYYIPILITWIRSSDFQGVEYGVNKSDKENDKQPYLYRVLMGGEFERKFSDIVGIEYVYFALLDEIYSQTTNSKVKNYIANFISKRKKFVSRLSEVPPEILSPRHKQAFLEFMARQVANELKL